MTESNRRRALKDAIRAAAAALRRDWDPIGNGQIEDLPPDEYDSYAPRVVSLIESGADDEAIAAHLRRLEVDMIGMASTRDLVAVAARVRSAVAAASNRAT